VWDRAGGSGSTPNTRRKAPPAIRIVVLLLLAACTARSSSPAGPDSFRGTPATSAEPGSSSQIPRIKFLAPEDVAVDTDGNLAISDCLAHRVYLVDASGTVSSLGAGHGGLDNGFSGDGGPAAEATYSCPAGLAFDRHGTLYIDDHANNRVRVVDAHGVVTTVAGSGPAGVNLGGYAGDGELATRARLSEPVGIAVDERGNLFIADRDNAVVRKVDTHGIISTIAGTGTSGFSGDAGAATKASLSDPEYVVVDRRGVVYFTDQINERIRMIDTNGVITTVAGTGEPGYSGDGGPAIEAMLDGPYGLAIDPAGNLFVSDSSGARVRMIDTNGVITTVAGTGQPGYSGDGGAATEATLSDPYGLAVDAEGNLYIADTGNAAIRMVDPDGLITTIVSS
jgi:trimeric autotransporter adhesin